jgi:acyl-CoA thioester hydrolase
MLIERSWRVTMADVDAAGVIYYGSPLRWAEMMLGDWLEQSGHPISAMLSANEAIPVVAAEVRYRSPLSLDDHCRLGLSARRAGRTSFMVRCTVWGPRDDRPAVQVDVTHAFAGHATQGPGHSVEFEGRALPPWLRKALEADHGELEDDKEARDEP